MMIERSVCALGTGASHGGNTSTVKKTAPVSLTARSTSDSASAPIPVPLAASMAHAAEAMM